MSVEELRRLKADGWISMIVDYCELCIAVDGEEHDWASHQPEKYQQALKELGFSSGPLSAEQIAAVEARA